MWRKWFLEVELASDNTVNIFEMTLNLEYYGYLVNKVAIKDEKIDFNLERFFCR